jgi:hypothetical protein
VRAGGRGHQPGAAHVHVHHAVPGVHGQLVQAFAARVGDGRVVDETVQTAQGGGRGSHAIADRRRVHQVHRHVVRSGAELGGQGLSTFVQHIADDHPRAGRHQGAGETLAQPAG